MEMLKLLRSPDADQGGGDTQSVKPSKTYNQDELNGIIGERLAKERAKIYSKLNVADEAALNDISTQLKSLKEENATLKQENETFHQKQIRVEKEHKLKEVGIDPDFIDVALAKWDGKTDLKEFVEKNPKLTTKYFEKKFQGTGGSLENKTSIVSESDLEKMPIEEFMEYKRTH